MAKVSNNVQTHIPPPGVQQQVAAALIANISPIMHLGGKHGHIIAFLLRTTPLALADLGLVLVLESLRNQASGKNH